MRIYSWMSLLQWIAPCYLSESLQRGNGSDSFEIYGFGADGVVKVGGYIDIVWGDCAVATGLDCLMS